MQYSIIQRALGKQWDSLPEALKTHHQAATNTEVGHLDIEYPSWMQPYLNLIRLFGALINHKGKQIPTTVKKWPEGENKQHWYRTIQFPSGKIITFKSHWVHTEGNEIIEYVNSIIGLRLTVTSTNQQLHLSGKHFVIRLGKFLIPLPESLLLGHTTIIETATENGFEMDFRLHHPLFGEIFRYSGDFSQKHT